MRGPGPRGPRVDRSRTASGETVAEVRGRVAREAAKPGLRVKVEPRPGPRAMASVASGRATVRGRATARGVTTVPAATTVVMIAAADRRPGATPRRR